MADGKEGEKGAEGGESEKGGEKKDPVQERINAEVGRRHKAEARVKELEDKAKADNEAALKATGEYKKLYEDIAPRAKLAEELEGSVKTYLAAELDGLSDEQKALIPEAPPHKQLEWLKKAKAAGVFGKQNPPDKTFNGKPKGGLPPEKWYLELEDNDARVGTLPQAQYLERKAYRKSSEPVKVRGGF